MSRSYSKWYQLKQHAYVYIVVISNIVAEISKAKVIYKVVSTLTTYSRIQNCIIIVDQAPQGLDLFIFKVVSSRSTHTCTQNCYLHRIWNVQGHDLYIFNEMLALTTWRIIHYCVICIVSETFTYSMRFQL